MRHQRPAPSDYFSHEKGSWKKNWKGRLPVALVFPSHYRVGMSNLGFQLVYDLLNQHPAIVCERVFLPEDASKPLSVESSHPLADFEIVFCSVSFEQDIPALLGMLNSAGIEPLAGNRQRHKTGPGNPLVIAGGVSCFINPEPLAPFVDMLVIGEAEPVLPTIVDLLLNSYPDINALDVLERFAALRGCYVPAFYNFKYDSDGRLEEIVAKAGISPRIARSAKTSSEVAGHSKILTPEAEFADLFLVELGRGCSRGCRFCAAGFVYRPPRLWSADSILAAIDQRFEEADRVGLLGMEMARSDELLAVADRLLMDGCRLSFSSLRADNLNVSLLELLGKSGLKTAAIAPDGASERLRNVINKGISREDILLASEQLVGAGIVNLKLYFMIGLPTELDEDLDDMVALVKEVRETMAAPGRSRGRLSTLTLSVNPFVPKAWTPFQYHPFADLAVLKKRLKYLRRSLGAVANLKIMGEKPERAFLQATLARGDRRMAPALLKYAIGGGNWYQVFIKGNVQPEGYAMRPRDRNELFPWEIIDHSIKKDYLWAEYQRALAGKATEKCDPSCCSRCGVCAREGQ